MSHAVEPPAGHRRPPPVLLAAGLLIVMALVGLGYALATLAMTPGTVNRFRAAVDRLGVAGADGYVAALWTGAGVAIAVAVLLFALYIALALGLCRSSATARSTR